MNIYIYEGPVLEFGRLVEERWYGETMAKTEKKPEIILLTSGKSGITDWRHRSLLFLEKFM